MIEMQGHTGYKQSWQAWGLLGQTMHGRGAANGLQQISRDSVSNCGLAMSYLIPLRGNSSLDEPCHGGRRAGVLPRC